MIRTYGSLILLIVCLGIFAQDTIYLRPGPEEGKDACVRSGAPNGNYKDYIWYQNMAWTDGGIPIYQRSYFHFQLDSIPDNSKILAAYLDLYGNPYYLYGIWSQHSNLSGPNESLIMKVTESWDESTITWNYQPSATFEGAVTLHESSYPDQNYLDIDLTDLVTEMYENPEHNFGFRIQLANENYYRSMVFISSDFEEPELRPELMVVYKICPEPMANFGYSIVNEKTVYFSDSSIYTANADRLWDFGDGYLSTLQNPEHTYSNYGFYDVCLTVTDSCGSEMHCDTLIICNNVETAYSAEISDKSAFFSDSSINASSWWWSFGDGYYSSVREPFHTYDEYGDYQVCLEASNDCSSNLSCDSIKLIEGPGIKENGGLAFQVFPNPGSNYITVSSSDLYKFHLNSITIFNIIGEDIQRYYIEDISPVYTVDISLLPSGLYFVEVTDGAMRGITKFIKY